MRFNINFVNPKTDERKSIVVKLTDKECASVESLRKHKGTDTAGITAAAYALRHAYREVCPLTFSHVGPPTQISLS
jgi:hypothetical protein